MRVVVARVFATISPIEENSMERENSSRKKRKKW